MKKILLPLFICSFQFIAAQSVDYIIDNWYLQSFYFDGQEVFIDTIEDLQQGPTMFLESDFTVHGNSFCNDYNGEYEFIDYAPFATPSEFIPRNISRGTENCGTFETMEAFFFIPFVEERTAEIVFYTQTGDDKFMVLQYNFGYQVYVNFPVLGVVEQSIKNLIIFPNPAQNELLIHSSLINFDSISIIDVNGKTVFLSENVRSKKIDVSSLKPGMYFITITTSEGKITKKFIKN